MFSDSSLAHLVNAWDRVLLARFCRKSSRERFLPLIMLMLALIYTHVTFIMFSHMPGKNRICHQGTEDSADTSPVVTTL